MGEEEGGRYDCVATTRLDTVSSRPAFLKVQGRYTVKKVTNYSVPRRDVTNQTQTLPDRE